MEYFCYNDEFGRFHFGFSYKNRYENLFDEYLDLVEFLLIRHPDSTFSLRDLQGANLGGIEEERFKTATEIFYRMDNYIDDYIIKDLECCLDEAGYDSNGGTSDWQGLIDYCNGKLPDNKWELDVLDMICNHSEDIDLENCLYEEEF